MVLFLLTGCSQIMKSDTTGIYIDKNGAVTEAVIDTLDQDYYDKDELKDSIDAAIKTYNDEAGKESISLKKFRVKKDKVSVFMDYDAYTDYKTFNNVELFWGTVAEAAKEGYNLDVEVTPTSSEDKKVSLSSLQDAEKEYHVVILNQPIQVELARTITYASSNVKVTDTKMAVVNAASETENGAQNTMAEYAYIVYK